MALEVCAPIRWLKILLAINGVVFLWRAFNNIFRPTSFYLLPDAEGCRNLRFGHGGADELSRDVLGLTKMNWNNDAPYDLLPTTQEYASTLARVIKRMPKLAQRPYPFRLFM